MSTESTALVAAVSQPTPWFKEPLLHFLLLGALLFLVDHYFVSREDDPHTIVVGADVDKEVSAIFASARGRQPDAKELTALRSAWLDNEVLYREGLALQVDKGDTTIRERVIFKALSVVDSNTKLPQFDEKTLKDWFEKNREKYDSPARYDFQEAIPSGDKSDASLQALVSKLNAGSPGDEAASLRVFEGRPQSNLLYSYGPEFTAAIEKAPLNEWRVYPSKDGLHAIRVQAIVAPKPANFDDISNAVRQDWVDATMSAQRTAAVRSLAKKYKLVFEGDTP